MIEQVENSLSPDCFLVLKRRECCYFSSSSIDPKTFNSFFINLNFEENKTPLLNIIKQSIIDDKIIVNEEQFNIVLNLYNFVEKKNEKNVVLNTLHSMIEQMPTEIFSNYLNLIYNFFLPYSNDSQILLFFGFINEKQELFSQLLIKNDIINKINEHLNLDDNQIEEYLTLLLSIINQKPLITNILIKLLNLLNKFN